MTPVPPRPLLWASGIIVIAGVVMGVLGAVRTGISWDEPYHVMRLRNYLDHGSFALDWAFGGDGPTSQSTNTAVYGPVAMLLLHGLTALFGLESWGSVSTSPAAYDARHLGVLLIGLAGTGAAAGITRILLGSWRWALVTAAVLLALPMWTGHVMFNIKDVPVATGYTLMTLALVAMVPIPGAPPVRWHRIAPIARIGCLAAGVIVMVGTRPAMATAVIAGLIVLAVGLVVLASDPGKSEQEKPEQGKSEQGKSEQGKSGWRNSERSGRSPQRFSTLGTTFGEALAGVSTAAALLLAIYPSVFAHPATLLQSAEQSASFRNGENASYGYVPFHVLAGIPLLLQAFFAVGLVGTFRFVHRRWRTDPCQATRLTLVGTQLTALPLVAIAMHSDLYNGLRQLLFASPAWAIMATVGLAKAIVWARGRENSGKRSQTIRGFVSGVLPGLAVVALVAPMLTQAQLFPYQYTYLNVALDATGIRVSSDYWRTSVPELLPRIPTDGQIICGPTRSGNEDRPETMVAGRYSSDSSIDCRVDPLGPLSSIWATDDKPLDHELPHDEFYALIDRDHPVPANCTRLAGVTRNRHGREIHMTYIARCDLEPAMLGTTPITFERAAIEPNMTPERWVYAPEGWVMRDSSTAIAAGNRSASLTFKVSKTCARQPCALVLDAEAPRDLTALVNDTATKVSVGADSPPDSTLGSTLGSVSIRLPPGISEAWVTLARESGEPLGLRAHSMRLTPLRTTNRR
jgi:hypothetical protein